MLSGCARSGDKDVLARIDRKHTITLAGFNERISKLPKRYQDVINKNKKEFLDEVTGVTSYGDLLRLVEK